MINVLPFILGFGVGSLAIIFLYRSRKNKLELEEKRREALSKKYELEESLSRRNGLKLNPQSKSFKTIQLESPEIPQDAFYEDNEVFITFCLKDLKKFIPPAELNFFQKLKPTKGLQMRNFSQYAERFEDAFIEFLDSGKMMIYSKTEGKLVETIKKDGFRYPTGLSRGYYLPDGTLFWRIDDVHFNVGHRWVEKK